MRMATVRIEHTASGVLENPFGQTGGLWGLRVWHGDGEERYRLIPALAGSGFLPDPLVTKTDDLRQLGRDGRLPRVTAVAVETSLEAKGCYQGRLRIVIEEESFELPE